MTEKDTLIAEIQADILRLSHKARPDLQTIDTLYRLIAMIETANPQELAALAQDWQAAQDDVETPHHG